MPGPGNDENDNPNSDTTPPVSSLLLQWLGLGVAVDAAITEQAVITDATEQRREQLTELMHCHRS